MASLKFLELQRLLKELQFVESDYLYQSELIRQTDKLFLQSVNNLLDKFPELKQINSGSLVRNMITTILILPGMQSPGKVI